MEQRGNMNLLCSTLLHTFILATTLFNSSEARISVHLLEFLGTSVAKISAREAHSQDEPYGSISPIYIAPQGIPIPPPVYTNPSSQLQPESPPLNISHKAPNLPLNSPGPSPPGYKVEPPSIGPTLAGHVPNPPKQYPGAPFFQPPIVSPPSTPGNNAFWCVAKPDVPYLITQAALDYACGSGADCKPISLNGPCYLPNTLLAHASYAFNNYWQKKKSVGGTCDFGGTAMLITVNPSTSSCKFNNA